MMLRRFAISGAIAAVASLSVGACSLVQSLDYLQADLGKDPTGEGGVGEGGGEGGVAPGTPLATNQAAPDYLVQDGTALYWLAGIDLMTVAKAGGDVRKIASVPDASYLAVDPGTAGNVYLAVKKDVFSVPKAGGTPVSIFKGTGAASMLADTVHVDDESLFLLEVDSNETAGFVRRMQKDGGAAELLSAADGGAPAALVVDPKAAVWYDDTPVAFFALAPRAAPATAVSYPLGAGITSIVPTNQQITMDGDTIYFVDSDDEANTLVRARKREAPGSATTIFRGTDEELVSIGLSGTWIYAAEQVSGLVVRIPKAGGNPEVIVKDIKKPTSLVVDDAFVYYAEAAVAAQGSIRKVPLPK